LNSWDQTPRQLLDDFSGDVEHACIGLGQVAVEISLLRIVMAGWWRTPPSRLERQMRSR
jgi:hypothetical protein